MGLTVNAVVKYDEYMSHNWMEMRELSQRYCVLQVYYKCVQLLFSNETELRGYCKEIMFEGGRGETDI